MNGGRFERQLPLFGEDGQNKIMNATVGVAGCGGLGVTLVTMLAEAGVSHFILADPGYPEIEDISTQFIYAMSDPRPKAQTTAQWITAINPLAEIEVHCEPFSKETESMFGCCDVIADCIEDIEGSLLLADYACRSGKTLVHGRACGLEGIVAVAAPENASGLKRALEEARGHDEQPSVGAAVSAVASLEALEVLKIVSGIGTENVGLIVSLDMRAMTVEKTGL